MAGSTGRAREANRMQVAAMLDPALHAEVMQYCTIHGMTRSAFARMAIEKFIEAPVDEWTLGYLDGLRTGQKDIGDSFSGLLRALREAGDEVKNYRRTVRMALGKTSEQG